MDPYREPIPEEGLLLTVQEFRQDCIKGNYNDFDGHGKFAKDGKMNPDVTVYPSTTSYPKSATHVVWFNK